MEFSGPLRTDYGLVLIVVEWLESNHLTAKVLRFFLPPLTSTKEWGPLSHYRFYLSSFSWLLNQDLEKPESDLPGFLQRFDFPNLEAAVKDEGGMTGTLCAVFAGDSDMLRVLVEQRADPNGKALGLEDLGYFDTQSLLMVAAKSSQTPGLVGGQNI